jgi:hypothetical protein
MFRPDPVIIRKTFSKNTFSCWSLHWICNCEYKLPSLTCRTHRLVTVRPRTALRACQSVQCVSKCSVRVPLEREQFHAFIVPYTHFLHRAVKADGILIDMYQPCCVCCRNTLTYTEFTLVKSAYLFLLKWSVLSFLRSLLHTAFKKWKSRGNTGKLVPVLTLRLHFLNCLIRNSERYKEMLFYGHHTNPIYVI